MNTPPWIPITGDDAGPRWPSWLNPAHVIEASFWTNDRGRRVATITLTDGRKLDLLERAAIDAVGHLTRGAAGPDPGVDRACARAGSPRR